MHQSTIYKLPNSLIEGGLFSTNLDPMILIIVGWGWQVDSARLFSAAEIQKLAGEYIGSFG
jgi:hypothetical protein